jgi:AraC-like DNA-binding protein
MLTQHFSTESLPETRQLEAWRGWYDTIFDVTPNGSDSKHYRATNWTWSTAGLTLSRVASPANTVSRTKSVIRHNPVDHWVITLGRRSVSEVGTRGISFEAAPQTPFILSFGDEISRRRDEDDQLQLILARDRFRTAAQVTDANTAKPLATAGGRMLGDYMLLLEQHVPTLNENAASKVSDAVEAMLVACLAPTKERVTAASDQIKVSLMDRVRRTVTRNLRSPSLGPAQLCREAGTSRSQLYRLLEGEGGVASYIQRRRLLEAFSILRDAQTRLLISQVAEMLCFSDASQFSRAFRREFGLSPGEVRGAGRVVGEPAPRPKTPSGPEARTFSDCLRNY